MQGYAITNLRMFDRGMGWVVRPKTPGKGQIDRCNGTWSFSTISGNWKRGTGLLNNELYIGRLDPVGKEIDNMLDAIAKGMFHESMKARISALPEPTPVTLHPRLADICAYTVADLSAALDHARLCWTPASARGVWGYVDQL
ncbi:hypothetical protein [Roseinatronobacter sp.]